MGDEVVVDDPAADDPVVEDVPVVEDAPVVDDPLEDEPALVVGAVVNVTVEPSA